MTYFTYETGLNTPVQEKELQDRVKPNILVIGVCMEASRNIKEVLELFISNDDPLTQGKLPVFPNVEIHPMRPEEAARYNQEGGHVLVEHTMKDPFLAAKKEMKPAASEYFGPFAHYTNTLLGLFQSVSSTPSVTGKDVVYFKGENEHNVIDALVDHYRHVLDMRM